MSEPLPRGDELIAEQQFSASMQDELEAFRTHHLAETSRLTREALELRAENERLRAALEHVVKADDEAISELRARGIVAADYDPVVAKIAREALATPAPVVPLADAKALASIVEGVSKQKWNMGVAAELAHSALAAFRSRHPAPKEPPQ